MTLNQARDCVTTQTTMRKSLMNLGKDLKMERSSVAFVTYHTASGSSEQRLASARVCIPRLFCPGSVR
jgi:hypothetical protein